MLQGAFVLFSGVIPLGQPQEQHPLWQMALKFGARCTNDMQADVTHVVAKSTLTEKVRRYGRYACAHQQCNALPACSFAVLLMIRTCEQGRWAQQHQKQLVGRGWCVCCSC